MRRGDPVFRLREPRLHVAWRSSLSSSRAMVSCGMVIQSFVFASHGFMWRGDPESFCFYNKNNKYKKQKNLDRHVAKRRSSRRRKTLLVKKLNDLAQLAKASLAPCLSRRRRTGSFAKRPEATRHSSFLTGRLLIAKTKNRLHSV